MYQKEQFKRGGCVWKEKPLLAAGSIGAEKQSLVSRTFLAEHCSWWQ